MDRFRVVICGGGIAAVEGLLRLRKLVGDAVDVTLIAPNDALRYRPLAVDVPFARRGVWSYPLETIARRTGAEVGCCCATCAPTPPTSPTQLPPTACRMLANRNDGLPDVGGPVVRRAALDALRPGAAARY